MLVYRRGGGGRAKRVSMTETHNVEDERDMYQVNTAVAVVMMRIMLKMMTWRGNERRRGW